MSDNTNTHVDFSGRVRLVHNGDATLTSKGIGALADTATRVEYHFDGLGIPPVVIERDTLTNGTGWRASTVAYAVSDANGSLKVGKPYPDGDGKPGAFREVRANVFQRLGRELAGLCEDSISTAAPDKASVEALLAEKTASAARATATTAVVSAAFGVGGATPDSITPATWAIADDTARDAFRAAHAKVAKSLDAAVSDDTATRASA